MSAPRGEEYYYRRSEQIQNEHPDWTTDQITNKMSEEIWNNNYNALMDDIAHSKTPEERDQKIKDYQAELDNYKASGINVDNDVEYLRDVQGMPNETISSKIVSLMSKYSFSGVEYQYSVPPDSFAFVEIPKDGISIEKYNDYQMQKNDDENTLHNSFQQQVEELLEKAKKLQFTNGRQLTDADREAGYQPIPALNGLTYVRARYEDDNLVIHPDDMQLYQESNQDVAKGMLLGGILPGVIKGVGASVKSPFKAFTQDSSNAEEMVTYRRVQGGTPPNASRIRINVDESGNVSIPNKNANLNISTDNAEHANYFLNKRGGNAEIVEFDVPKWFDDLLDEYAIPQKGYKSNLLNQGETAPKIVDPNTPGKSYELPSPWVEWLEEYAVKGRTAK